MDAQILSQADMARGQVFPIAGGSVAVFSARCRDKDGANEDAAAWIDVDGEAGILAVADGLGGAPGGEQASCLAIRQLVESVAEASADGPNLRTGILNGIESANRTVSELGIGAATTLAIAEIRGRSVRPYHVGDSMILVVGQRGKVKLQTVSHSPVGYAVESGLLDEAEAMHHEDRHVVSNVIGAPDMRIEVGSSLEMARFDTLLLASDGLPDNLHAHEIIERIRKGTLARVIQRLADDTRRRMHEPEPGQPSKPDDLTLMVFRPGSGAFAQRGAP